jgi:hypothetical protein
MYHCTCNFSIVYIKSVLSSYSYLLYVSAVNMQGIRHALGTVGIGGEKGPHPYMMEVRAQPRDNLK